MKHVASEVVDEEIEREEKKLSLDDERALCGGFGEVGGEWRDD